MNNVSTNFWVQQIIDCNVRPILKAYGGGVRMTGITEEGCVQLELEGACRERTLQALMFALSIRQRLLEVPGISNVTMKGVKVAAVTLERIGQFYQGYSFQMKRPIESFDDRLIGSWIN
jgi:Fe-S cluster biogenesis protein NfuA